MARPDPIATPFAGAISAQPLKRRAPKQCSPPTSERGRSPYVEGRDNRSTIDMEVALLS